MLQLSINRLTEPMTDVTSIPVREHRKRVRYLSGVALGPRGKASSPPTTGGSHAV